MATEEGIFAAMMKIEAAGLNAPSGWRALSGEPPTATAKRRAPIVATWHDAFADHDDGAILAAVVMRATEASA